MKNQKMIPFLAKIFAGTTKKVLFAMLFVAFAILLASCSKDGLTPDPVIIPPKPIVTLPTVTTTAALPITETIARSGGEILLDGGSAVTARGVCWDTTSQPTVLNNKTSDGTGVGSFTSTLSGLIPGKTYFVRSYAINSLGTAYGNETSVTLDKSKFTITASVIGTGGSISPSGITTVTMGDDAKFTYTADRDYKLESVTINGVKISPVPVDYTFKNVIANGNTISVTFVKVIDWLATDKMWYKDSVFIKESDGSWSKYKSSYKDSIIYSSNGKYIDYHNGAGTPGSYSYDPTKTPPTVDEGQIWMVEMLSIPLGQMVMLVDNPIDGTFKFSYKLKRPW